MPHYEIPQLSPPYPRSFAIFGKTLKEEDDEYDENAEYEEEYDNTM